MSVMLQIKFDLDTNKQGELFPIEGAKKLVELPGLKWKVWTVDEESGEGSGLYLYATRRDAEIRAKKAIPHLTSMNGVSNVTTQIFEILEEHSEITRAPLDVAANPSYGEEY
ncbi:YdhR family protein [Viridibacillus sp. FSL E2-0187]|uniref:YdhR family protein n=1 Tax=Viridibacillus TaxID=496496 RepID=UPI0030FAD4D7